MRYKLAILRRKVQTERCKLDISRIVSLNSQLPFFMFYSVVATELWYVNSELWEKIQNLGLYFALLKCLPVLRPIHTKSNNYKDNYISVHTSGRYRPFILSYSSGVDSAII